MVEGNEVNILVDSGAHVSLIGADFRMSVPALRNRPLKKNYVDSRAVNGRMLDTLGTVEVTFRLGPTCWRHTFHVLRESTQSVLLGLDFLAKNLALLDLGRGVLQLWDVTVPLLRGGELFPVCRDVSLADVVTIPPLGEALVPVTVCSPGGANLPAKDFEGYLEPNIPESTGLVVAHTVNSVKNGVTSARILNPSGGAVELKRDLHSVGEPTFSSSPGLTHRNRDPVYSLSVSDTEMLSLQREDPDISTVVTWLERGASRPPRRLLRGFSATLRKLRTEFNRLSLKGGLLCRTVRSTHAKEGRIQVVVSSCMVPELLRRLHGGPGAAHFSAVRVWEKARQSYYWPFMLRDIKQWCEQCRACQTRRCPVHRQKLYHDEGSRHQAYQVGALVWLSNPTESRTKLAPHWKGPYRVVQVLASGGDAALTCRIINPLDSMERAQVVHHDRLKPYTLPLPPQTAPPPPPGSGAVPASQLPEVGSQPQAGGLDYGLWGESGGLEPSLSRRGRVVRPPSHLKDFIKF